MTLTPIRPAGGLAAVVFAVLLSVSCAPGVERGDGAERTVLRGVTVVDGTGAPPLPGRDVVIQEGRIVGIVPTESRPEASGDRVLELPGRTVMPGIVDTHAHVTILDFQRDTDGTIRAEYRRDLSEEVLRLLLAHGVTTVRNPSAPLPEGAALRDDVASGAIAGPRILTSGPHLNDPSMSDADIRAEVRAHAAAGADFIKVYASLDAAQVGAAIEEAHALGLPVVGHLQRTGWTEAARLGIDGITHGASWDRELLPEGRRAEYRPTMLGRLDWIDWLDLDSDGFDTMVHELADRRIPVDPTLITYHTKFFGDDPRWTHHPGAPERPPLRDQICRNQAVPLGWIATRYMEGGERCPRPTDVANPYNAAVIERYRQMPLGATMTVCADQRVPQNWVREWNRETNADCPGARVSQGAPTVYVMRRVR